MEKTLYHNLLQRLFDVNLHGGTKLGLSNVIALCKALIHPEKSFRSIHIAGTNGKGSVAVKVAKGLQCQGNRVGLYISPHISSFRERISIDGKMISEEDVTHFLNIIFSITEQLKIPATFFEITTVMAFCYFAAQKVDYAVLETGLGGRLDATNVVAPDLTVITSIALEHTEILGDTLELIGKEKGGILKPGVPVVLGPRAHYIPMLPSTPYIKVTNSFTTFEMENRAIAEAALKALNIDQKKIKIALTAHLPCRLEAVLHMGQRVLLDVAHNPDGLSCLFRSLKYIKKNFRIVCGISKTKDLPACLSIIRKHASHVHLVQAPNGRGASPEKLKEILLEQGMSKERISLQNSIHNTIKEAIQNAPKYKEEILICGSFFIMSDVRQALNIDEPRDPFDMQESKPK
ncbi:MAG TPA: Mur ligase family protein [Waddliaceae bacterium]